MRVRVLVAVLMLVAAACSAPSRGAAHVADAAPPPPQRDATESGRIVSVSTEPSSEWLAGLTLRSGSDVTLATDAVIARRTGSGFEVVPLDKLRRDDLVSVWAYETLFRNPAIHHARYVLIRGSDF